MTFQKELLEEEEERGESERSNWIVKLNKI